MKYPWLDVTYRELVAHYAAGRGHHALLLHATADNDNDTLAYALSCWLLCQQRNNRKKSCGNCDSCRLMLAGNHPDYHLVMLGKSKQYIGIEPIRYMIEMLYTHAQQGGAKVIHLSRVELLTEAATNALLKTLEEPPEDAYFLLSCREPSRLLATLRSRCLYWRLLNQSEQVSMQWLSHHAAGNHTEHLTALRLQDGAVIAAKELLKPEHWKQRSALCKALSATLLQHNMLSLLPVLNHLNIGERLHWLCSLLVDAMKLQLGAQRHIINQDQQPLVSQLADCLNITLLPQILQHWLICRHQLLNISGVNHKLLLTEQLLNWEQMLSNEGNSSLPFTIK